MTWLRTIAKEMFGLFVDDGIFAILILIWLCAAVFLLPHLGWVPRWRGIVLFFGLALILIGSVSRYTPRSGS